MRLAMVLKRVERALDGRLVVEAARRSERRQPRRPLAIVGEQPMHIGAGDLAALRHRAVKLAISEAKERPLAVRTARPADMHLVAPKRRAVREARAFDLRQRLFAGQHSGDVKQLEAFDLARRALPAARI